MEPTIPKINLVPVPQPIESIDDFKKSKWMIFFSWFYLFITSILIIKLGVPSLFLFIFCIPSFLIVTTRNKKTYKIASEIMKVLIILEIIPSIFFAIVFFAIF